MNGFEISIALFAFAIFCFWMSWRPKKKEVTHLQRSPEYSAAIKRALLDDLKPVKYVPPVRKRNMDRRPVHSPSKPASRSEPDHSSDLSNLLIGVAIGNALSGSREPSPSVRDVPDAPAGGGEYGGGGASGSWETTADSSGGE